MGELTGGDDVAVVMVPFPLQSHLNQLLQLSCLLTSSYSLPVYYVSSSRHIKQLKARAAATSALDPSHVAKVRFHDLPMDEFESPPPNPNADIKFPTHLLPTMKASPSLREPFAGFLPELCREFRRVVVINDMMMCSVVRDAAAIANAETYAFNAVSTFTHALFVHDNLGKRFPIEYPKQLPPNEDLFPEEMLEFSLIATEGHVSRSGDLFNTCRSMEAPFLNLHEEIFPGQKFWAIGPMLQLRSTATSDDEANKHPCLQWLDSHEPNSVIYVSFGTTTSLTDEEIRELAMGLEQSGASFLWILREADRGDVFDGDDSRNFKLPLGFEERVGKRGYVYTDWAPQIEILAHPSTGGFMSHCGWNSCLESIRMGVPLAAWPMHSDQPGNAFLVTEVLKAGLAVREWENRKEVMRASVIAGVVRRLMMGTEEGDEVRKRAKEIGEDLKKATEEGGETRFELDSFVAHVTRK